MEISELRPIALNAGYQVEEVIQDTEIVYYFFHDSYKSNYFPNEAAAWMAAGQHASKAGYH